MTANVPVREIELHAREYLAEIAVGVIHERMEGDPLEEIHRRITANIRGAEAERARMVPLIGRFVLVRDRLERKDGGENFLRDVVQTKIDTLEMNRLQIQLQVAKMHVALELLAHHTYARDVPPIASQTTRLLR